MPSRIIHLVEHVQYEGPGYIRTWAALHGHQLRVVPVYAGVDLPPPDEVQMLILMGGPMGVHDHPQHRFLTREQTLVRKLHERRTPMLGICLGAQLMAAALGGSVEKGAEPELGWFPVTAAPASPAWLPPSPVHPEVLHWHFDVLTPPPGAETLFHSPPTPHQAFVLGEHAVGVQFHPEANDEVLTQLLAHATADLQAPGSYVQSREVIWSLRDKAAAWHPWLDGVLKHLVGLAQRAHA